MHAVRSFVVVVLLAFGCSGSDRSVVCPTPPVASAAPTSATTSPVQNEAEAPSGKEVAADWIHDQKRKLLKELEAIDDSLRLVPLATRLPASASTPEELLTNAKVTLDFLRRATLAEMAESTQRMTLAELARRQIEGEQAVFELASHYGNEHPRMREARARLVFLATWAACQKQAELESLEFLVAALESHRPGRRPEPDAVERIVVETTLRSLRIPVAEKRCFPQSTPISLQLDAMALRQLELTREVVAQTLGPGHPTMMNLDHQVRLATERLDNWREVQVLRLELRLTEIDLAARRGVRAKQRGDYDRRIEERLDKRERLIEIIIHLERKERDLAASGDNAADAKATP